MNFVDIVFASLLANHLVFFHAFGVSELLTERATGLGKRTLVLTGLLVAGSLVWWAVDHWALQPFHLEWLRTALTAVVVGAIVALGAWLSRVATVPALSAREYGLHTVLVGGVLMIGSSWQEAGEVITAALAVGLGYGGALALLKAVEVRLVRETIPRALSGLPLPLLTLGLVWLILHGLGFAFAGKAS